MLEDPAEAPSQSQSSREARLRANYEGIAQVLNASARGRWFLAEHARRSRAADTSTLLEAIVKLELAVLRSQRKQSDQVLSDLVEISEAIERTRQEIAAIRPSDQLQAASSELDGIVAATEKATSEILGAAEEVQEVGWILREKGADQSLCDILDQRATDIYTTCSFQDLTGQRTGKVVRVLRFIEQRINAMIEMLGADDLGLKVDALLDPVLQAGDLLDGPRAQGSNLAQGDVDAMFGAGEPTIAGASEPAKPEPRPANGTGASADARPPKAEPPKTALPPDLSPGELAALFG